MFGGSVPMSRQFMFEATNDQAGYQFGAALLLIFESNLTTVVSRYNSIKEFSSSLMVAEFSVPSCY